MSLAVIWQFIFLGLLLIVAGLIVLLFLKPHLFEHRKKDNNGRFATSPLAQGLAAIPLSALLVALPGIPLLLLVPAVLALFFVRPLNKPLKIIVLSISGAWWTVIGMSAMSSDPDSKNQLLGSDWAYLPFLLVPVSFVLIERFCPKKDKA